MIDIIATYALLSSGIVANKILLKYLAPDLFVALRMFISGVCLLPFALWNSHRMKWHYMKEDIATIFFISLCTTLVPSITKAFAYKYMLASKTALLGSIDPFVTALYAY